MALAEYGGRDLPGGNHQQPPGVIDQGCASPTESSNARADEQVGHDRASSAVREVDAEGGPEGQPHSGGDQPGSETAVAVTGETRILPVERCVAEDPKPEAGRCPQQTTHDEAAGAAGTWWSGRELSWVLQWLGAEGGAEVRGRPLGERWAGDCENQRSDKDRHMMLALEDRGEDADQEPPVDRAYD
ncbi:MAG TPA: hypothetical protein VH879_05745 [Gemmatimonadales bacterium]|jgi:hypothetical protein